MTRKTANPTLVDEKMALSLFLDSLLREPDVEVEEVVKTESQLEVMTPQVDEMTQPSEQIQVEIEPPPEEVVEISVEQPIPPSGDNIPTWAQEPFQAMLFKVAGLTLAVPLESLNGVVEWTGDLTEMPGHADFYLGILQHLGHSVPVVDTARLVFPQDRLKELTSDDPVDRVTRIVLINDGRWGLACDEVAEVVTLRHDEVRWRSQRTKRRWLLGTVIDQMCALLDTDAFAEKLTSGEDA